MSELSPRAKVLLQQTRTAGGPSAAQRAAVRDAVLTSAASGLAGAVVAKAAASAGAPSVSVASGATVLKVALVGFSVAVVGAGTTLAVLGASGVRDEAVPTQRPSAPPPQPRADTPPAELVEVEVGLPVIEANRAPPPPRPAPDGERAAPRPTSAGALERAAGPRPTDPGPPPTAETRAPTAVEPTTTPARSTAALSTPDAAQPTTTPDAVEPPTALARSAAAPATLDAELAALDAIATALEQGRSSDARDDAQRFRRRYPSGALLPEAIVLEALAHCALGDEAEARAVTRLLSPEAARSPAAARLRGSCVAPAPQR